VGGGVFTYHGSVKHHGQVLEKLTLIIADTKTLNGAKCTRTGEGVVYFDNSTGRLHEVHITVDAVNDAEASTLRTTLTIKPK
jgi:hypothetical protein